MYMSRKRGCQEKEDDNERQEKVRSDKKKTIPHKSKLKKAV